MNPNICDHCGSNLECRDGHRVCPLCGAHKQLILSEEEFVLLRKAFQKLRLCEFDEAERDFEELIQKYPENAEGYWGRLMLKFGITYKSDDDGRKRPVCDSVLKKSIKTEEDYIKAESLASKEMAEYYRLQAEYIDHAHNIEVTAFFDTDSFGRDGLIEDGFEKQGMKEEDNIEKSRNKSCPSYWR